MTGKTNAAEVFVGEGFIPPVLQQAFGRIVLPLQGSIRQTDLKVFSHCEPVTDVTGVAIHWSERMHLSGAL